jgi:hypothetical protein
LKSAIPILAALAITQVALPAQADDRFPKSGMFIEREQFSESELDFAKRELGFPDEVCTFVSPKRIKPNLWQITTICNTSEDRKTRTSKATLEKRGKTWRLRRGDFVINFEK